MVAGYGCSPGQTLGRGVVVKWPAEAGMGCGVSLDLFRREHTGSDHETSLGAAVSAAAFLVV